MAQSSLLLFPANKHKALLMGCIIVHGFSCSKILLYQAAWLSLYAEGSRQQPRPLETLPWLARQSGLACSYSQRTSSAAQAYTLEDSSTQTKGNF